MVRPVMAVMLISLAACAGAGKASPGSTTTSPGEDVVHLTDRTVVRGRIVGETENTISVAKEGRVAEISRSTVYAIDYSAETYRAKQAPPLRPTGPDAGAERPVSSWYPRHRADEAVEQTEVTWVSGHAAATCLGKVLPSFERFPDLRIAAAPGGRVVFHDPRKFGYHAHVFKPEAFHRPADEPGLSLRMPAKEEELPEAVAFVSPSQEMKSQERTSHAVQDCLYAKLVPLSVAPTLLSVQAWAGGKAGQGPNGEIWAVGLPRNAQTWMLLVLDNGEGTHAKLLKTAYAAYGETLLSPDFMIDTEAADGRVAARILVLPYPDVPADGGAGPVTLLSGPTSDPTVVAQVALPPRQVVVAPARRPATKADVWVQHYEVAPDVPQSLVVAHGIGRLSDDVTLVERELTPTTCDERVRIDVSALPEERFPVVAWLMSRRLFAWRTVGGRLGEIPSLRVPPGGPPKKLTKLKGTSGVSHLLPITFTGPKPPPEGGGSGVASGVAGGMSSALMQDALAREAGGLLDGLTANLGANVAPGGGGSYANTVNLTVVVPPHSGAGPVAGESVGPSGMYLYQQPGRYSNTGFSPDQAGMQSPISPAGSQDGRTFRDRSGNVVYDPATGQSSTMGKESVLDGYGTNIGGGRTINIPLRRRSQP